MKDNKIPLGQQSDYPDKYAPELLCPIQRSASRDALGIGTALPFRGVDIWNIWELSWLGNGDRPEVATAEIHVPADSPNIIESKSLKLYVNSFSMSRFASADAVAETITMDLSTAAGSGIRVQVQPVALTEARNVARLAGTCLDSMPVKCSDWEVNPELLRSDRDNIVREDLHSHLLRSLCPVTSQPDIGSLQISYRGPRIEHEGLLRYIVSFRMHNDFHESCIERMFIDLMARCAPEELSIHGRYQRRGGIDINPWRSNCDGQPRNLRIWRQ